ATASMTRVYVVGGAVRDRLLGRPTTDLDLVVDRDPEGFAHEIAKVKGGTAFPLDQERGIFRATLKNGIHIDVALRQGKTFEEDIDRRDFTVNAFSVPWSEWNKSNWKKSLLDRHHGLRDLQKKLIVPVSDRVMTDDPLRLLRAFRIAAELDFKLSSETIKA